MPGPDRARPVEILLVEDCQDDADLMREALAEGAIPKRVSWVEDGEEAMAFLHRQGDYPEAPRPDLILLDYRLPRKNGREVLDDIRQDPELCYIPVVVMTSNEAAIPELYDHYPNCCVAKPADQDEFREAVKKIEYFWLNVARRYPQ